MIQTCVETYQSERMIVFCMAIVRTCRYLHGTCRDLHRIAWYLYRIAWQLQELQQTQTYKDMHGTCRDLQYGTLQTCMELSGTSTDLQRIAETYIDLHDTIEVLSQTCTANIMS